MRYGTLRQHIIHHEWRETEPRGWRTSGLGSVLLLWVAALTSAQSVAPHHGSFTTEIPVVATPFRGLEPKLKLVYNSGSGNSWLGVGWTLSGPSRIERGRPGGGVPRYNNSDAFFLDGMELIPTNLLGGTHCTKIQNYARVERDDVSDRWYVTGSNGHVAAYEPVYTTAAGVYRWGLTTLQDPRGNTVVYSYWWDAAGNESYLDTISYNGTVIRFHRDDRPDRVRFGTGDVLGNTRYRLRTIEVTANGQPVRTYKLEYSTSPGNQRSLLARVQQFGNDYVLDPQGQVIGGTSLPTTSLVYTADGMDYQNTTWNGQGVSQSGRHWADLNGDGRADYVTSHSNGTHYVSLSTGTGFINQTWSGQGIAGGGSWWVDLNGDGKADYVTCNNSGAFFVSLSTGSGYSNQTWSGHGVSQSGRHWADLNGDGKTDYVTSHNNGTHYVSLSTGTGFTNHTWSGHGRAEGGSWWVDLNGDGKHDYVTCNNSGKFFVSLSTGSGYVNQTWNGQGVSQGGRHWVDLNGDGLTDYVTVSNTGIHYVSLSTGAGFINQTWNGQGISDSGPLWTDLNGDGLGDYVTVANNGTHYISLSKGQGYQNFQWQGQGHAGGGRYFVDLNGDGMKDYATPNNSGTFFVSLVKGPQPDLLKETHNGIGGSSEITYTPSSAWTNTYLPVGVVMPTASTLLGKDGRGNTSSTTYQYEGGLWSASERRFLGFRKVTSVIDCQGNYTETFYLQREGSTSKPEITYLKDNQGQIFTSTAYVYDENSSPPYTSLLSERWTYEYNLGAVPRRTLVQMAYDEYGNVISTIEHGDYDLPGDERTTIRGYYPNSSAYIVGLPAYENLYEGVGTAGRVLARVRNKYDGNSGVSMPPGVGNQTEVRKWNDQTGTWVVSLMTHDAWGNVVAQQDPRGHWVTSAFDPTFHIYPLQVSNELNQTTHKTWDLAMGLEASSVDFNGATTTFTYDALGRLASTLHPGGNLTSFQYLSWGDPNSQRIRRAESDGSSDGLWTEVYQDGMGREYRTVKEGGLFQETIFGGCATRVWKESLPWGPNQTPRYRVYTYDGAGRQRTVTLPDGAMSQIVYANDSNGKPYWALYDELGHEKVLWKDAYGNVVQIRESLLGNHSYTTFEYDVLGRLLRTVDALGNASTYIWDSLGRKTQSSDTDMGTWTYAYDAGGLLVSQTDAKSQTMTFTYDAVGRRLSKSGPEGVLAQWSYDEGGHGASVGRLTRVSYPSGSVGYVYDVRGLPIATTRCVQDVCQTIGRQYDVLGRLTAVTYPDGETVPYTYDQSGRLRSMGGYVTNMLWTAEGQLSALFYGNATTTVFDYDPNRQWLTNSSVTGVGGQVYHAAYTYDAAARVTAIGSNTHPSLNLNFAYDDLDRLVGVSGGQQQAFTYDAIGNMTFNSRVGAYLHQHASHVHAASSVGGKGLDYDANGNLTSGLGHHRVWDSQNRMINSQDPEGRHHHYAYDADGQRILKGRDDSQTRFFGNLVEDVEGALVKYYYAGPVLVAKRQGGAVHWYHADHLGSVRLLTDGTGQVAQSYGYGPFGEGGPTGSGVPNTRGFTGHQTDPEGALIYMGARYYDPFLCRFISPDTIVPSQDNPQALNRYAYVFNNPISNTDPTGHAPVSAAITLTAVFGTGGVPGLVAWTATVGAGLSVAGYLRGDDDMMALGSVLLGFAGGYTTPGAGGNLGGLTGGLLGATFAGATSSLSGLDDNIKKALTWAWMAYGAVDTLRSRPTSNPEAGEALKSVFGGSGWQKAHTVDGDVLARLAASTGVSEEEWRGFFEEKLPTLLRDGVRSSDGRLLRSAAAVSEAMGAGPLSLHGAYWGSGQQQIYGAHVARTLGNGLNKWEAILLNPTGGLTGPGALSLNISFGPLAAHSAIHDADGYLGNYGSFPHASMLPGSWAIAGQLGGIGVQTLRYSHGVIPWR